MKFIHLAACWVAFALQPLLALSQSSPIAWRFEHLTVNEGLSHSDAMAIVQDQEGFMWVGTNRGLDRYDGQQLRNYPFRADAPLGLSSNRIRKLYISPSSELWVGTENGGLNYYDRQKDCFLCLDATRVPHASQQAVQVLAHAFITGIAADKAGRLWVGTQTQGLFVVERDAQGRCTGLHRVLAGTQSPAYEVSDVKAGADGSVWVGTSKGLYKSDCLTFTKNPIAGLANVALPTPAIPAIQSLYLDHQDNLWIGAGNHVYFLAKSGTGIRGAADVVPALESDAIFPGLSSLLLDSFGRLWIGTEFGMYLIHPQGPDQPGGLREGLVEHFVPEDGVPTSLSSGRIHQVLEDRFQMVWICTSAGGVNRVDLLAKPFGYLHRQANKLPSLPSNYINAIYKEESRGLLWIATRNGFSKYDLAKQTYQNYLSQEAEGRVAQVDVSTIFQDSRGTLWFGTWHDGFACLRRQGGKEHLTRFLAQPGKPGLSSNSVIAFAEDRAGFLWVATSDAGINQYTREGVFLKTYSLGTSELPTNLFRYLYYDPSANVLWASTHDSGLLKLQPGPNSLRVLAHFVHQKADKHSLAVNYLWPIMKDHAGSLWLGSLGGGLHQLVYDRDSRETIQRYGRWLPESDVESILEDEQGNLWLGGSGLLRFNPRTKRYLKYDVADGLQSNSFKVGAAWRAQDGTLYFGGINGISYFNPRAIRPNPYPPIVVITALRVLNKPVSIGDTLNGRVLLNNNLSQTSELTIDSKENDFSLDFVGLHYANPGKITYAYQLEGYYTDWVYPPAGQRTASFANLAPGSYTFRVKASNGDGLWSTRLAQLHLVVLPPWWKTWWAYSLYSLTILGILLLLRHITTAQQQLKNKLALEQIAHEKDQELNDLKLRFFTNVSHELRTPLTLILGPMEELIALPAKLNGMRNKLLLMHRQTRKLLTLVNQLLDFRKAESEQLVLHAQEGDVVVFVREIFLIFQAKAYEKQIDYSFETEYEELSLYFDRNKLEIVLSNLLVNAFKYTPVGGKICVSMAVIGNPEQAAIYQRGTLRQHYLQLAVRDSGVGMKFEEISKIFDIYYQATHTETMQVMGTGIGLALVKQMVECHRGEITVDSQPGAGTQFRLKLPLGHQHLLPQEIRLASPEDYSGLLLNEGLSLPPAQALAVSEDMGSIASCKLLIVEDNEEVLQYLGTLFEPLFAVQLARNGVEGWVLTQATLPDLVLSDVMMPHSDGLELCRNIRQHAKTMHIPVLLLTARAAAMQELEGVETGADDYVTKPFHPELLKAKVVNMLHNRQKLQEYYHRQILLEPTQLSIPDEDRLLLEKAMHHVEAHLEDPDFNVQALVREIGISQSVLYRRIKNITGQTVIEFIHDVRMKRAAQLLRESRMRISEIAFKIGMDNVKRFRKTFQKLYQMTPSEYAKKYQGIELEAAGTAQEGEQKQSAGLMDH